MCGNKPSIFQVTSSNLPYKQHIIGGPKLTLIKEACLFRDIFLFLAVLPEPVRDRLSVQQTACSNWAPVRLSEVWDGGGL